MRSMVRLKRDECIAYRQSLDGADVLTPPKALDAGRGDYFAVVMPGCTEPGPVDGASFRVLDRAAGRVRIALPSQDDGQCAPSR
ncbi:paar motif family protein [Burkholderia pseudomallei]|nr:paar motif family protein [Burkholderia pseudomallei]